MKLFRSIIMGLVVIAISTGGFAWQAEDVHARSGVRATFYVASWGNDANNNIGNNSRKPLRSLSQAIQQAGRVDYGTIQIMDTMFRLPYQDLNLNQSINFNNNVTLKGGDSRRNVVVYNPYRSLGRLNVTVNSGSFSVYGIYFNDVTLNVTTNRSSRAEIAGNSFSLYRTRSNTPLLSVQANGTSWAKVNQNEFWLNNNLASNQYGLLSDSNGAGGTVVSNNLFRFNVRNGSRLSGIKAIGRTSGMSQIYSNTFNGGTTSNVALDHGNVLGKIYFVSNNLKRFNGSISKETNNPYLYSLSASSQRRLTARQTEVIQTNK